MGFQMGGSFQRLRPVWERITNFSDCRVFYADFFTHANYFISFHNRLSFFFLVNDRLIYLNFELKVIKI